jgi:hypothetical protein
MVYDTIACSKNIKASTKVNTVVHLALLTSDWMCPWAIGTGNLATWSWINKFHSIILPQNNIIIEYATDILDLPLLWD